MKEKTNTSATCTSLNKHMHMHAYTQVSHKSVFQKCPNRVSYRECPIRVSHKSVQQEYHTTIVLQECPTRVSCRSVPRRASHQERRTRVWAFRFVYCILFHFCWTLLWDPNLATCTRKGGSCLEKLCGNLQPFLVSHQVHTPNDLYTPHLCVCASVSYC